jgi:hypothetical protein
MAKAKSPFKDTLGTMAEVLDEASKYAIAIKVFNGFFEHRESLFHDFVIQALQIAQQGDLPPDHVQCLLDQVKEGHERVTPELGRTAYEMLLHRLGWASIVASWGGYSNAAHMLTTITDVPLQQARLFVAQLVADSALAFGYRHSDGFEQWLK